MTDEEATQFERESPWIAKGVQFVTSAMETIAYLAKLMAVFFVFLVTGFSVVTEGIVWMVVAAVGVLVIVSEIITIEAFEESNHAKVQHALNVVVFGGIYALGLSVGLMEAGSSYGETMALISLGIMLLASVANDFVFSPDAPLYDRIFGEVTG